MTAVWADLGNRSRKSPKILTQCNWVLMNVSQNFNDTVPWWIMDGVCHKVRQMLSSVSWRRWPGGLPVCQIGLNARVKLKMWRSARPAMRRSLSRSLTTIMRLHIACWARGSTSRLAKLEIGSVWTWSVTHEPPSARRATPHYLPDMALGFGPSSARL